MPAAPTEVPGIVDACDGARGWGEPPDVDPASPRSAHSLAPGYCVGPPVFAQPWRPEPQREADGDVPMGAWLAYLALLGAYPPPATAWRRVYAYGPPLERAVEDVEALAGGRAEGAIEW